jgi:EAL domain-containing protein (putative c-di-GMP-specific phosphodiesterase class I)
MLGDADLAMYRAKRAGSNQTAYFTLSLREAATDRARLAAELQRAVADDQLVIHYQPVVDLRDGRAVGAEALVRLRDGHQLLPPDDFLPLARTLGLMPDLTRIVLDQACRDFAGAIPTRAGWWVSVNLGADESGDPQLCQLVSNALRRSGLPAQRLIVEVSERALPDSTLRSGLGDLAAIGVRVALDDFGSGWSSFAQLRSLPLHMVKLDRDLTAELRSGSASGLFRAVVALARDLDLIVVAEGIEHPSQPRLVREAGCQLGQGYQWGQPGTLDDLVRVWAVETSSHHTAIGPPRPTAITTGFAPRS